MSARPTLIYDGKCGFCEAWVGYWRGLTGERVEYLPYQEAAERFPEVPAEDCRRAVQLVTPEGRFGAAEAVFRLLALAPGFGWWLWLYRWVPGFAAVTELGYRAVAANRDAGYWATRALWGRAPERSTYHTATRWFEIALALVYMAAFASFGTQARGLVGSSGILPVREFLETVRLQLGPSGYWRVPTVFWWASSDFALLSVAWGGVALAAISIVARPGGSWRRTIFAILFVYYLSIVSAGQIFMGYQWDYLLLEAGFLAIFLRPERARVWLFQWLAARLMFESGAVKLLSHDTSWRDLTAMAFHYQTQPLPTALAWYAMRAPLWFQKASTAMVFAVELGLPWMAFGPRRMKQTFALGTLGLQALIFATGNYTYFNLLTMALCLMLLDDRFFGRWRVKPAGAARGSRAVTWAVTGFVAVCSAAGLAGMFGRIPAAVAQLEAVGQQFGLVNRYGLFAVMTTMRPEIEVQGSLDGERWEPYTFRYKPGELGRAPGWVAPMQPRLDWQMWFAALGNARENPWFARFVVRLLQGSRPVMALLERDPFGGTPPKRVRALVYEYRFTSAEERRKTGNWWARRDLGVYFPPVGLR